MCVMRTFSRQVFDGHRVFFVSTEVAQDACNCVSSSFLIVRFFSLTILLVYVFGLSVFVWCNVAFLYEPP